MYALLIAIAAASQTPKVVPASNSIVDYCATYGDYAFVIMEDVRRGRAAATMLQEAEKSGDNESTRNVLTGLVLEAFEVDRVTQGAYTPKRFSDEQTIACYTGMKEKERVQNESP